MWLHAAHLVMKLHQAVACNQSGSRHYALSTQATHANPALVAMSVTQCTDGKQGGRKQPHDRADLQKTMHGCMQPIAWDHEEQNQTEPLHLK